MSSPAAEVKQCSFRYREGQFQLKSVSMQAAEGRMLGVVGPNGSGKSTLLRLMAGILRPDEGAVHIIDRPIDDYRPRDLAREVAFLPQSTGSSFQFTVREVVEQGRYPYQGAFGLLTEQDRRIVTRALVETESVSLQDRHFSTLSGGERQRVLVASILAQDPRTMLLDEPGASLDIHHKSHIFDLLWRLAHDRCIAVVVVTHDLNLAAQFCDELVLMREGTVCRKGNPDAVMDEEVLSSTYQTSLKVVDHPITGHPLVVMPGEKDRRRSAGHFSG